MTPRLLRGALLGALLTIPFLAHPAAAVQEDFALDESGTDGVVVSCDPSAPAACHWRLTGTATGTGLPYGQEGLHVIVDLRTGGAWDADGCQPLADGSTVTFHRRLDHTDLGWRKRLNGRYCTAAGGGHVLNAVTVVEPASRPGRYRQVTGAGTMTLRDGVGNTPGSTGPWQAGEAGVLTY
ncbi:hypothetical protein [Streptomyces sp. NPDC058955]|uniref:hypothetical protein n=1 Tax=unclassified Streptomyces TaxID=2593676 RepID=UPI00366784C4